VRPVVIEVGVRIDMGWGFYQGTKGRIRRWVMGIGIPFMELKTSWIRLSVGSGRA
jgi:hypothetical protein